LMKTKVTKKQNEFQNDEIDLVRRVMEDMFILLFFDGKAYQRIGFTNISRLIVRKMAWYLWTKDRKAIADLSFNIYRTVTV
jgi:hypothetical protein